MRDAISVGFSRNIYVVYFRAAQTPTLSTQLPSWVGGAACRIILVNHRIKSEFYVVLVPMCQARHEPPCALTFEFGPSSS